MTYLLSGSLAYDTILLHKGQFSARILPNEIARLNVAFGIDSVRDEFGGTAGNIAYNASLLQDYPVVCASVGDNDFKRYAKHLHKQGIKTDSLHYVEDENTAHAWLLTDRDNNQITGFNSGAMKHRPRLPAVLPDLWHLSPDSPTNTAWLAKTAMQQQKKYFFDPGQCLPAFLEGQSDSVWKFSDIVENSSGIFVNEYEYQLMQDKMGIDLKSLLNHKTEFIVQTLGSKGLCLHTSLGTTHISVAKPNTIVDPTGCGDALRAGFLHGIQNGWCFIKSAQLGSTMGSFAIETSGGQNHQPSRTDIMERFDKAFSKKMKLIK